MDKNKVKTEDNQFDAIVVGQEFLEVGQQKNFVNKDLKHWCLSEVEW